MELSGEIIEIKSTHIRLQVGENKQALFDVFYGKDDDVSVLMPRLICKLAVRPISKDLKSYKVAAFRLSFIIFPTKPKAPDKQKGDGGNWSARKMS